MAHAKSGVKGNKAPMMSTPAKMTRMAPPGKNAISDPMAGMPPNIPVHLIPGLQRNVTTNPNDHSALYVAPPKKFAWTPYALQCKEYLKEAMRRYRKFKIPGIVNNIMFDKQLDDVLREAGLSKYDLERIKTDGGGLADL